MNNVYIIAEIGQNHNGNIKMAKQLIDVACLPIIDKAFNNELEGVNAVKFTKRDLTEELTKSEYNKLYISEHSFGKTYGEHREKLELSYENHIELYYYSKNKGIDFIETLTSPRTLKLLESIELDYIKVASRDLTNIPLIKEIARSRIKIIISTGMSSIKQIDDAIDNILAYHDKIIILHCVSQYPAYYKNINLLSIPYLKERYNFPIGYSDHSIGIVVPVVAVALGAEYIEKHITLSHSLKGSDHKCALEPDGLWRMVRDIRNIEIALGSYNKVISNDIDEVKLKLERSVCSNRDIKKGEIISESDIILLSPGNGLSWMERLKVIGKKANIDIPRHELIDESMVN